MEHKLELMVVDDEPKIREVLHHALVADGYDVVEAADAEQTLELLDEFLPDLILVDIRLPKMDGLTLIQRLRSRDPNLPLITFSGSNTRFQSGRKSCALARSTASSAPSENRASR